MRFFQKSRGVLPSGILGIVSKESFAQLKGLSVTGKEYNFELLFKLDLNNSTKNILDYERIGIQIKTKAAGTPTVQLDNQFVRDNSQRKINPVKVDQLDMIPMVSAIPGVVRSQYPSNVAKKVYSGVKATDDLILKEKIIYQSTVWIENSISESVNSVYSYVDLEKPDLIDQQQIDKQIKGSEFFDSDDIIAFVNKYFFTLSQYEEANVSSWSTPQKLFFDYLYEKIPKKPSDDKIIVHRAIRKIELLQEAIIGINVSIPIENKESNLDVTCMLYKRNSLVPDEVLNTELYMPGHVEEYESLTKSNSSLHVSVSSVDIQHKLSINLTGGVEERNKIFGFNVYKQIVESTGTLSEFQLIQTLPSSNLSANIEVIPSYPLEIIRVIPIYKDGKEAHIFRDVVIGNKYETLGALTITVHASNEKNSDKPVVIDVHGVPKEARHIELYRRICANPSAQFEMVSTMPLRGARNVSMGDNPPFVGGSSSNKFEYFVVAFMPDTNSSGGDKILLSNYVSYEHILADDKKGIQVLITDLKNKIDDTFNPSISFNITTKFAASNSSKLSQGLQVQIFDLYNKYMNPQNIDEPAVTGNQPSPGVPEYTDLIFHEIVRTNITTGEREVFEMIGEGIFEDTNETRAKNSLKPINPQNNYLYQVFTYTRNPIELFKNYVAHGVRTGPRSTSNGREWFYLPYKWNNPQTKNGLLYSSDSEGMPIIPEDESFRAKTYGLTATLNFKNIKDQVSVQQVFAKRVSKLAVKISWDVELSSASTSPAASPYDSFIVMAVVNGKKKYVGITRLNFMYHMLDCNMSELDKNDYGTIYYIIIPILKQLYADAVAYSNEIIVDPAGLHDVIKIPYTTVEDKLKQAGVRSAGTTKKTNPVFENKSLQKITSVVPKFQSR